MITILTARIEVHVLMMLPSSYIFSSFDAEG